MMLQVKICRCIMNTICQILTIIHIIFEGFMDFAGEKIVCDIIGIAMEVAITPDIHLQVGIVSVIAGGTDKVDL